MAVVVHALTATNTRAVTVIAAMDDSRRRYEVSLEVCRIRGRWVVSDITG
jgi:hypothetical protein